MIKMCVRDDDVLDIFPFESQSFQFSQDIGCVLAHPGIDQRYTIVDDDVDVRSFRSIDHMNVREYLGHSDHKQWSARIMIDISLTNGIDNERETKLVVSVHPLDIRMFGSLFDQGDTG